MQSINLNNLLKNVNVTETEHHMNFIFLHILFEIMMLILLYWHILFFA